MTLERATTIRLKLLVEALKRCSHNQERIDVLDRDLEVRRWLQTPGSMRTFLAGLSQECELIIKSLVAIGQQEHLFATEGFSSPFTEKMRAMLDDLLPVESFYREMGGVVGYHMTMYSLLSEEKEGKKKEREKFYRPPGIDISHENALVRRYIIEGILTLPRLAEIYPVGGAADRLRFCDPKTALPLPAAKLPFCKMTLLEGLVRDVAAKEYLYYQLFKEQLITPIAMMTSKEKDNHHQVLSICEENNWFGRPKESFRFFCQPLVPTMDKEGEWSLSNPMKLMMKPGGHGAMWKVAKDQGVFDWLESQGREKVLIRQINNPIAAVDYGLLAFCGIGFKEEKLFGFASCPRRVQSAEGVNVLLKNDRGNAVDYCLTSVEYCDFQKFGIEDVSVEPCSPYSQYPSNTNILFADIAAIKEKVKSCPIPGMLVNLKKMIFFDDDGHTFEREIARLESTMQNIADCFVETHDAPISERSLKTFLTYHRRQKTISTTKKEFQRGGSLLETPEGCYYDLLQNAHELLTQHCGFTLPYLQTPTDYLKRGPSVIFHYHPALGPLYQVIAQKIEGGKIAEFGELQLEIAEIKIKDLTLDGSLHIFASQPMGGKQGYSPRVGRCQLINVVVENAGIDRQAIHCYWKGEVIRKGLCEIVIHGDGEFYARDVALRGDMRVEVGAGVRMTAYELEGELQFKQESISSPSWNWDYQLSEDYSIRLHYT